MLKNDDDDDDDVIKILMTFNDDLAVIFNDVAPWYKTWLTGLSSGQTLRLSCNSF